MINSFMKTIKGTLGIPAKSKVKSSPLFGKSKHDFELYEHYKGGLYRLLLTARSEVSGLEQAVYRSESTGVVYTRPMREFKDKFKKFDVGM